MTAADPVAAGAAGVAEQDRGVVIRGLRKSYGDTIALDGLDLDARPGEILGVAGPNGAGKSTMIKILAAETTPDGGTISIDGVPWTVDIGEHSIAVVHQEPQLFPNLSVGDNIIIGHEHRKVIRRGLDEDERAVMESMGIFEVRDRLLGMVPLAIQQRTEIARALVRKARVFLFDEPNSALTEEESDDLFRRMKALADDGRVVILVSHRLAELVEHAHRVSVILDGVCTGTLSGDELTQDDIAAELVVGQAEREETEQVVVHMGEDRDSILTLRDWTHEKGEFRGIDLHVRTGEIVALVGVEGSGARELVRSIAGFERGNGHFEIHPPAPPASAQKQEGDAKGSSFVPADRQSSLFANLDIGDNMVSRLNAEIASRIGTLRRGRMKRISDELRTTFQVKTSSLTLPIRSLSGGNQQKVAIAAAIVNRPQVLVLEEPTRGVDIGSKAEIYQLMREYAREGHAVIIYCTEVPEVFEVADFAYVVSDGQLSDPIIVMNHIDVESLARAITRLERHGSSAARPAASGGDVDAGDGEGRQGQPGASVGDG